MTQSFQKAPATSDKDNFQDDDECRYKTTARRMHKSSKAHSTKHNYQVTPPSPSQDKEFQQPVWRVVHIDIP